MIDRWIAAIIENWPMSFIVGLALLAIIEGTIWYHAYRLKQCADKWWAAEIEAAHRENLAAQRAARTPIDFND